MENLNELSVYEMWETFERSIHSIMVTSSRHNLPWFNCSLRDGPLEKLWGVWFFSLYDFFFTAIACAGYFIGGGEGGG